MKLSTGDCVVCGSDDAIFSVTENEILVFSARLPEFSNCVSMYVRMYSRTSTSV